ncbi:hypothetical protein Trydic_g20059 [Trypoxylus dichotomus]
MISLPKREKDPTIVANQRPISLLSTLGKILQRLLQTQLTNWLEANEIIPSSQFNFHQKLCATQQAMNLVEEIKMNTKPRSQVIVALLDIEKSLDRVWRKAFVFKMMDIRVPWQLSKIQDWLRNRKFQVRVNNTLSSVMQAREGFPQGSSLFPILSNIFVLDMSKFHETTGLTMFAGDTALVATGKNGTSAAKKLEAGLKEI